MKAPALLITLAFAASAFAGCFGGDAASDIGFDFEPGKDFEPTGNTVKLKMWVKDIIQKEIWPDYYVNMWAFCAAPADPSDEYSVNAIEYRDEGSQCSIPGPQLRVQQGDRVIVEFDNPHIHHHTIHWHGQYVPNDSDGVQGVNQDSVEPNGGKYTYDFVAERAGTLWYHCHVDTPFHVMMGLYGMMIVEPQDTTWEPKDVDKEYSLVFSTAIQKYVEAPRPQDDPDYNPHENHDHSTGCGASGKPNCQNPAIPEKLDVFMINGVSFPKTVERDDTLIVLKPGEKVRLRLLNAGGTFETFHTHGHDMYVTHRDGNPLHPTARFYVDTLTIGPAERYDVILEGRAGAEGAWVAHTHVEHHITNDWQAPGGMHTAIAYEGSEDKLHQFTMERHGGGKSKDVYAEPPADHRLHERVYLSGDSIDESWDIPVEDLCFIDEATLTGDLHASRNADDGALGNKLTFTLTSPGGEEIISKKLTRADGTVQWYPEWFDLEAGNYTASLTGSVGTLDEASFGITASATYFSSLSEAEDNDRKCR